MIGTWLAVLGAILAITSWFHDGWLKWIPLCLAFLMTIYAFFEYAKERNGNAAMFLGCIITWLSLAVQLFLAGYI